jgi:hypothetical protein
VSTLHGSSAHVQWRANKPIHTERMTSDGCANDVDNGIDRADLVKVDRLDGHVVNPGFGFAQKFECPDGHFLGRGNNIRRSDDVFDRGERSGVAVVHSTMLVMMMTVQVRMRVFVVVSMVVGMVMRMRVLVLM